jgi:hypothetical protein
MWRIGTFRFVEPVSETRRRKNSDKCLQKSLIVMQTSGKNEMSRLPRTHGYISRVITVQTLQCGHEYRNWAQKKLWPMCGRGAKAQASKGDRSH